MFERLKEKLKTSLEYEVEIVGFTMDKGRKGFITLKVRDIDLFIDISVRRRSEILREPVNTKDFMDVEVYYKTNSFLVNEYFTRQISNERVVMYKDPTPISANKLNKVLKFIMTKR